VMMPISLMQITMVILLVPVLRWLVV